MDSVGLQFQNAQISFSKYRIYVQYVNQVQDTSKKQAHFVVDYISLGEHLPAFRLQVVSVLESLHRLIYSAVVDNLAYLTCQLLHYAFNSVYKT